MENFISALVLLQRLIPGKCGGGPPGPTGPGKRSPPGPGGVGNRPRFFPSGNPLRGPEPGGPAFPSPDICPDCVPEWTKTNHKTTAGKHTSKFTKLCTELCVELLLSIPLSLFRDCISNWLSDCLLQGVTMGFCPCSSRLDSRSINFLDEESEPTQTRANLLSTERMRTHV